MNKPFPILLFLLLLTGCGSKKFYTLGDNLNIKSTTSYSKTIDVVKVTVPKYLKEHKIVRQITPYQIELVDKAQWLIPMEKKLTEILIDYLQQALNNPNVHLYPWDSNNKTEKRISIEIKNFIASDKKVMLKANYKILNLKNNTSQIKLFKTTVPITNNIESMMQGMEKAYLELIKNIKTTIINNK
jgi:uncharacterized lipoprotein YmbA